MSTIKRVAALTFAAVLLVFAGATGALATLTPGHQETPSCDPHPNSGGPQNKHCEEPAPAPTTPAPPADPPVEPEGQPSVEKEDEGGGGGGGGGAVAEPADAVPAATLPFTGFDVPQALILASLLTLLGATALALGRRRAARIE